METWTPNLQEPCPTDSRISYRSERKTSAEKRRGIATKAREAKDLRHVRVQGFLYGLDARLQSAGHLSGLENKQPTPFRPLEVPSASGKTLRRIVVIAIH